jgi:type VI secretion system protein ImpL
VRGVYFTSGTQEGTPIAKVIDEIGRNFGIAFKGAALTEPVKETKAYFIRDLFQEVVLPDEALVHPTSHSWRRRKLMRGLVNAAQLIVTAVMIAFLAVSHSNNRKNNLSLLRTVDDVADATRGAGTFDLDKLDRLDLLREHLERVEAGPSLMSRWGLYSTDIVADAARQLYFDRYSSLMVAPTISLLEISLHEPFACEEQELFDQQYNRFRAYRMLTLSYDSIPKSPGRLKSEMIATWMPTVPDDQRITLESLVERQVAYYWKHRSNATIPKIQGRANASLIAMVNGLFDQCWNINRLYLMLISDVNDEMRDYSYEDALATLYLQGGAVGGAFTREGWEKNVLPRIDSMPVEIQRDPVKAQAFASYTPEQIQSELTDKYVAEFVSQWKNFITSGRVTPFGRLEDAINGTDQLAQDPFPLTKLLEKVYEQGDIVDIHGDRFRRIEDEFHQLGQFFGLGNSVPEGELRKDTYNKLLANLPGDIDAVKASLESNAQCGGNLGRFMDKVSQSERLVSRLVAGRGLAGVALGLLKQPFNAVRAAARSSACDCLDREWKNKIWDAFNLELSSVYPFNRNAEASASPQQVQTFFQAFKSFEDREIDPARTQQIPVSRNFQEALSAAQGIQRIMGSGSTDKVRFNLGAAGLSGIRTMHFEYSTEPMWTYVAGQPQTRDYRWPQPGGGKTALWIESIDNAFYPRLEFDGDWGIFKFFDRAQQKPGGKLSWTFESSNGRPLEVQLSLTGSQSSFIMNGHFTQFRCPESVCR